MLRPQPLQAIPVDTTCVAKAAFKKGTTVMRLRDLFGTLFCDEDFASLFPPVGQPALAPWRLALVTIFQFLENLTDRQAADAVRGRVDWKYALSLELEDLGFDFSVLSEFRDRLVAGGSERLLLDKLLELALYRPTATRHRQARQLTDMARWACDAKDVRHNAGYLGAEWRFQPTPVQDNEKPGFVSSLRKAVYHHDRLDCCYRLEPVQQQVFELLVRLRTQRHDYPGAVASWEEQPERQGAARPESKSQAAFALAHIGRFTEADALAKTALADTDVSPLERAGLLETRGVIAYYMGDMAAGFDYFDTSVAILRATQDPNVLPKLMQVLRLRATTYWAFFRQADAIQDTEEAMHIASELGRGRDYAIAQTYLGVPLTELGEYERAEETLLESREVLRRADAREHLAACEAILGGVYINWQLPGMNARALSHTRASLRISEDVGAPVLVSQSSFYVAWAELIAGNAEASESFASRGLSIALEMGQRRFASIIHWIRGLAREQLGRITEAVADLDAVVALAEGMGLEGHRLMFLIDRDRLLGDREAVKRHLVASKPYNFTGFRLPMRQRFTEMLET